MLFTAITGLYCGSGINGALALLLQSEEPSSTNQFQMNMLTFNIMTIIAASLASIPWLYVFRHIYGKLDGSINGSSDKYDEDLKFNQVDFKRIYKDFNCYY